MSEPLSDIKIAYYIEEFNKFLNNQTEESTMKTIKSFEQKGWALSVSETRDSMYLVELKRDEISVDCSGKLGDYSTASIIFDEWLKDLTVIITKGDVSTGCC